MRILSRLAFAGFCLLLAACSSSSNSPRAVATEPARNNDGTFVNGVITARFDPSARVLPFPINLLFQGTTDLTLNIPVANPNNFADPQVALNALDGFSTTTPITFSLSAAPMANTLVAGSSIRVFEAGVNASRVVIRIVRELQPGTEFIVAQASSDTSGRTVAIVPTRPLRQMTTYLVVVTDGIRDQQGNDATSDQTYFLSKRTQPLCINGQSTDPLIAAASACALEPLRLMTNAQELAAASQGIATNDIVLSWAFTTQSITPVLQALQANLAPGAITLAPSGQTTAVAGLPAVADIYIGTLAVPYFSGIPTPQSPTAALTSFWRARPGNYNAPFSQANLDPTSTNLTFANPLPDSRGTQNIPMLLTVPNAASGRTKPAAGWPVVIFQHGITRNRTDALAVSATFASQGFAVIAIDLPLHGLGPASPFYVENTPFGASANERTFDMDLINNQTGAAGPDGSIDSSGAHFINLSSLLTSRDNVRQGVSDLIALAKSIPTVNFDGVAGADFDGSRISFTGQSLGAMVGAMFLAVEPTVNIGVLNVPGGGIARFLIASPTFGPRINAGLAASGVQAGTAAYDQFLGAMQTAIDSADPINFGEAVANEKLLAQLVVGNGANALPDQVIPISVPGAPLSGGEALVRAFGLSTITASTQSASGIRGVVRFIAGDHGSLLSPAASAAATAEMQGEMLSMTVSAGNAVQIANPAVIRTQ